MAYSKPRNSSSRTVTCLGILRDLMQAAHFRGARAFVNHAIFGRAMRAIEVRIFLFRALKANAAEINTPDAVDARVRFFRELYT